MNIQDHVWQVKIEFKAFASTAGELIYGLLLQCGVAPQDIVEKTDLGRSCVEVFRPRRRDAEMVARQVRAFNLNGVRISVKRIKKTDWQSLWKKGIKPFALTKNIEIIPRWTKSVAQKNNKFPIYIDTNLAFGTGLHETTRFMSQMIESCRGRFTTFLDVGTGSGILAIVGSHCGAKEITAFDVDPQSIKVAKENLAANKVSGVKVFSKDIAVWKNSKTYDFVAANLVTHDLIKSAEDLARRVNPGKYLAVSGISLPNLPALKKAFAKLSLKDVKTLRGKTWAAVLYQRKS